MHSSWPDLLQACMPIYSHVNKEASWSYAFSFVRCHVVFHDHMYVFAWEGIEFILKFLCWSIAFCYPGWDLYTTSFVWFLNWKYLACWSLTSCFCRWWFAFKSFTRLISFQTMFDFLVLAIRSFATFCWALQLLLQGAWRKRITSHC